MSNTSFASKECVYDVTYESKWAIHLQTNSFFPPVVPRVLHCSHSTARSDWPWETNVTKCQEGGFVTQRQGAPNN